MVMVRPQRWQLWTVQASETLACIATWQTGQGFGGVGFGSWLTVVKCYRRPPRFHYGYLRYGCLRNAGAISRGKP